MLPSGGGFGRRAGASAGAGNGQGDGGQSGISATTFASFKSCMSDNGVTITESDPQAALRTLDRSDAKTSTALQVCQAILGPAGADVTPAASPSPTP